MKADVLGKVQYFPAELSVSPEGSQGYSFALPRYIGEAPANWITPDRTSANGLTAARSAFKLTLAAKARRRNGHRTVRIVRNLFWKWLSNNKEA